MSIIRVTKNRATQVSKLNPNMLAAETVDLKVYVFGICVYKNEYIHTPL